MVRIKGPIIINRFKYISENGAADDKEKIIAKLDPEYQKIARAHILPVSWFPIDFFFQLTDATLAVIGKGDVAIYSDMGRFSAIQSAKGFYKIFFKLGSPEFIIKKAPALWNQIMDSGECYSEVPEKRRGIIGVRDFGIFPPQGFCLSLKGWTIGLLENSGAKDIKIDYSKKPSAGDFDMEYAMKWS